MVELTGMFGEEIKLALEALHEGIDAGKKTVKATHDFESKLIAIDQLLMFVHEDYWQEDIGQLLIEISDKIKALREELEALEKGEIHIILEEEATKKKSAFWILKHRKKIEEEIKEEIEVSINIIKKLEATFVSIKALFVKSKHIFSVNIGKATINKIKIELEEGEEEVKHILEKLMQFILAYEHLFTHIREDVQLAIKLMESSKQVEDK